MRQAEQLPDRGERPLAHVGQHAKGIGDADRGHHERDEEHDPEEVAPLERLGAEQGEAEPKGELEGDAGDDVDEGHHQGAWKARRVQDDQRQGEEGERQEPCDQPAGEAEQPGPAAGEIAPEPVAAAGHCQPQDQIVQDRQPAEGAEEVELLGAYEELREVARADEADLVAAGGQGEAGQGEIGGGQQREQGEGEQDQHRRQDHHRRRLAIGPGG